jgi:hypothetical protein
MFVAPNARCSPITALRKAASTCGMCPDRTVERSSSNVTSRTQCSLFSMCQCSRHSASTCVAVARSGVSEVTAYATALRVSPVRLSVTRRSTRKACATPGQSLYPTSAVEVVNVRRSSRFPCRSICCAYRSCKEGSAKRIVKSSCNVG